MSNKECDTTPTLSNSEEKSITIVEKEIQQSDLQVLSKMFEPEDDQPETLLMRSAQQLSNLAHSYMEHREKAYLENDPHLPTVTTCQVDDIVKLSLAANEQMKTALHFKKEKIQALKILKELKNL